MEGLTRDQMPHPRYGNPLVVDLKHVAAGGAGISGKLSSQQHESGKVSSQCQESGKI